MPGALDPGNAAPPRGIASGWYRETIGGPRRARGVPEGAASSLWETTMKLRGMFVASAALGLLAAAPAAQAGHHEEAKVKCAGINSCAGTGKCAAADGSHDCGGKNSCKGKGWIYTKSADECTEKGGSVVKK